MRTVNAVARAVGILELLADGSAELPVAVIATRMGIPRNTTYELVGTLEELGLVRMHEGRVRLGVRLFELGSRYASSLDLLGEARDIAARLRDMSGETVHLAALHGRYVTYLLKEESRQAVRMSSAVGLRLPAHVSAVGKAMLAALPPDELARRLEGVELERFTEASITSGDALGAELADIRRRGYAIDEQESSPGVRCVAAASFDAMGDVVAGISISGPVDRMGRLRDSPLAEMVRSAAAELSGRLGGGRFGVRSGPLAPPS